MTKTSGEIYGQKFDTLYEALAVVLSAMCADKEEFQCPLTLCMGLDSDQPLCPLKGIWCDSVTVDDWLTFMESTKE